MLILDIVGGILLAVGVLFFLFRVLSAPSRLSQRATEADFGQLVADYHARKTNFGGGCYWQQHTAWREAFPEEAAKDEARPLPFRLGYVVTLDFAPESALDFEVESVPLKQTDDETQPMRRRSSR
jgi:hypothetical protein